MSEEIDAESSFQHRLSPRATPRPRPLPVPDTAEVAAILARRDPSNTLSAVCSETLAPPSPPAPVTDAEADTRRLALALEFDSSRLIKAANSAEAAALSAVVASLGLGPLLAAASKARPTADQAYAAQSFASLPPDSPAFQRGRDDNPTVIVLSAPGQAEAKASRPAAGHTGKEIDRQLAIHNARDPVNYPSVDRRDYRIINSVDDVHYLAATKRTEGRQAEVTDFENVTNKRRLMEGKSNALVFGDNAVLLIDAVGFEGSQMRGAHPSPRRINTKYRSEAASVGERKEERSRAAVDDMDYIPARASAPPAFAGTSGVLGVLLSGLGPVLKDVSSGSLKVGLRQGLGALMADLAITLFREVRAHFAGEILIPPLERLRHACMGVLRRWADYVRTFLRAGLSNALRALVDAILEAFLSVGRRLVRLAREGASALFGTLGLLVNPSQGMPLRDRLHEASKIATAGAAVAAGILVEEAIARALTGVPFADLLAPLAVGLLTGLSTVFLCHLLDRADLFGAIAGQRERHVQERLLTDATQDANAAEDSLARFLAIDWTHPENAEPEQV